MMDYKFKVNVRCMTFNHSAYIEEAMNGFCMQQTKFPFVCTIIDDCSTDGEQEVINKYLHDHFDLSENGITRNEENDNYQLIFARHLSNTNCFFAVFFLKYNHYSIKRAKSVYTTEWTENSKYRATCEGDDYWTALFKLQKQVDFLDEHPDFTMVCNRTKLYSEKKHKYIGENYCYNQDSIVKVKDVIYRGGLFISTCSVVYRKEIIDNYPDYCRKCAVGDYPLQIMAAMKGKIYYFNDIMSVYRVDNSNSWMGKQRWFTLDERNLKRIDSMINMFKGFSIDYPKCKRYFSNKIAHYHISQSPSRFYNEAIDMKQYIEYYKDDYKAFPLMWKVLHKLRLLDIPIIRGYYTVYTKPIYERYREKYYMYNDKQ